MFHQGEEAWCKGSVAKLGCTVCLGTPSSQRWITDWQKSQLWPKGRDQTLKTTSSWSIPGNVSLRTSLLVPECGRPSCWPILYHFPFHYLKSHCLFAAGPPLGRFHNQPIACSKHLTCMGSGCKCISSGPSLLTVEDVSLELQNCYVATLCYWKRHKCLVWFCVIPTCI